MAGSYTLPQVRVFQEFAQTPNDVTQNLNPFVIGPHYQLIRYSAEDERAYCSHDTYKGVDKQLTWATGDANSVVDRDYFKVTLADAFVSLGAALSPVRCADQQGTGINLSGTKFEFNLNGDSLTGTSNLKFGVAVKTGDYVSYMSGTTRRFTKIVEITQGKPGASEVTHTLKTKAGAVYDGISVDLTDYTLEKDLTIRLDVTGHATGEDASVYGHATWSTSDAQGLTQTTPQDIKGSSNKKDLGVGGDVGIKIYASANVTAGTYYLKIAFVEPYARDTIRTADFIPYTTNNGTNLSLTFVRHFDEIELDQENLRADATGVTVLAGATYPIGSSGCEVLEAQAYLTQRNLIKNYAGGVYAIDSYSDITKLGAIDPANPLVYGLDIMYKNCASASIKYIALESNDRAGYATALSRVSSTTEVYAFCPLTEDAVIIDDVVADCKRMSTEEEKSWRISFFSKPTERYVDLTPSVGGDTEQCKVTSSGDVVTLTCYARGNASQKSTAAHFNGSVREGDTVYVNCTDGVQREAKVASVTSDNTLRLKTAIASASSALCSFQIVHEYSHAEYVDAIATTSSKFRHHRAYNVFPNRLTDTDGNEVEGMYAAAAVCALACSVAPQQPITNVEINGFADLKDTYSTYSRSDLNTIAAGGTLIIMQEKRGGTVYVRHQISTAYPDGNLNTTELSLIKNLDSISYYFANRFAPYIGRYNLTEDLLTELRGILLDGLTHLETTTETNRLIGPQVIAEGTEIRALYRDTTEKDKAYANVALNLPAPFNNFDLHLQVI